VPPPGWDRDLVLVEIVLAAITFAVLLRITAPYGRYRRAGWGPTLPSRPAWVLMESPAPLLFAAVYLAGAHRGAAVPLALAALWEVHYAYRSFVYPVLLRPGTRVPLVVVLLGVAFNVLNSWINARWVGSFGDYPGGWFVDPRFLVGVVLFLGGLTLNVVSDRGLRRLRAAGGSGYRIPHGGAFEWVSCPNYLGEIVEWTGWALAAWSLAGLAFALYVVANLAPRALAHHDWYRRRFPDYPPRRRALVPFVW
jgi:protein-S-isoprenylcysteine O-methyltransferase Ste14